MKTTEVFRGNKRYHGEPIKLGGGGVKPGNQGGGCVQTNIIFLLEELVFIHICEDYFAEQNISIIHFFVVIPTPKEICHGVIPSATYHKETVSTTKKGNKSRKGTGMS